MKGERVGEGGVYDADRKEEKGEGYEPNRLKLLNSFGHFFEASVYFGLELPICHCKRRQALVQIGVVDLSVSLESKNSLMNKRVDCKSIQSASPLTSLIV
jgi:hypothetical protein